MRLSPQSGFMISFVRMEQRLIHEKWSTSGRLPAGIELGWGAPTLQRLRCAKVLDCAATAGLFPRSEHFPCVRRNRKAGQGSRTPKRWHVGVKPSSGQLMYRSHTEVIT